MQASQASDNCKQLFRFLGGLHISLPAQDAERFCERIASYWLSLFCNIRQEALASEPVCTGRYTVLHIAGEELFGRWPAVLDLLDHGKEHKLIGSLDLRASDWRRYSDIIQSLCENHKIGYFDIAVNGDEFAKSVCDIVECANVNRVYITIHCSAQTVVGSQLFCDLLSGQNVEIVVESEVGAEPREAQERSVISSSCATRFMLFVREDGQMYSCKGLADAGCCGLGSIFSCREATGLADEKLCAELERLARKGPEVAPLTTYRVLANERKYPVTLCSWHRQSVTRSR